MKIIIAVAEHISGEMRRWIEIPEYSTPDSLEEEAKRYIQKYGLPNKVYTIFYSPE